jgi:hypothetical protein
MISIRKFSINKKILPICAKCVNFIADDANHIYDRQIDDAKYAKCKKFYEMNLITGNKEYEFAHIARADYNLCGRNGIFYEKYVYNQLK